MSFATKAKLFILDNLVWMILFIFFLFNAIFTPSFATGRNLLNILFQSSLLGMLVLAQGIVMMVGELDLSLDAILAFGPGIAMLIAGTSQNFNPYLSIIVTLIIGALVGLFNGYFVAYMKTNSFILTLSTQIIMRGLILFLIPFSLAGLDPVFTFLGRGKIGVIPIAAVAFLVIFFIFELFFRKTVMGRKFILTGGNRRASFISGIKTRRVIVYAFIIAGVLAAVAGLIAAGRQNAVSNIMGQNMVTMAIAGAILGGSSFTGGAGKPIGMLGGALLLGMIDNSLTLLGVNVNLVSATKGVLIFFAILLDRARITLSSRVLYKENIRKLDSTESS